METSWSSIQYRDFWDVPRIFVTQYRGMWFLFDCTFDDETEDFPDTYQVSLISPPEPADLAGSWIDLPKKAVQFLAEIPIARVQFDPTRRKAIDDTLLAKLTVPMGVR
jgi:hypothetical protein